VLERSDALSGEPNIHRLTRDTWLTLASSALPLAAALVAIPILLRALGDARFGVLTLLWALIGYLALFDFGLSRALARSAAARLHTGGARDVAEAVWTGLGLLLALGLVVGGLVAALRDTVAAALPRLSADLRDDVSAALGLLAFSIPFVLATVGLRGLLEARQRFPALAVLRTLFGTLTFVAPLAGVVGSASLPRAVLFLAAAQILSFATYLLVTLGAYRHSLRAGVFSRAAAVELIVFGSWTSVSNFVGPLIVYLNQFLLAALVSAAAVAYYGTPFEVISRLLLAPAAVTAVVFPALVRALTGDAATAPQLYRWGLGATVALTYLPMLGLAVLAEDWMTLWLGAAFAKQSAVVAQWLLVGVFLNSLAQMPFAAIQAAGRADVGAKIHLAEVVPYLLLAWLLIDRFGVVGAAWAWVARAAVDAALMFVAAGRVVPAIRSDAVTPGRAAAMVVFAAAMAPILPLTSLAARIGFIVAAGVVFCLYAYVELLTAADREGAVRWLRTRLGQRQNP
jgi:O-antigen/teichoic acid export membrane protein